MASILRQSGGRKAIQYTGADGRRPTLYLGRCDAKTAATICVHVEALAGAVLAGVTAPRETMAWLGSIGGELYSKLANLDLCQAREKKASATLGAFVDAYLAGRTDVKASTATVLGHTRRCLLAYFGRDKNLAEVSPGDADAFRLWLAESEALAENTVRRRCGIARQFFRAALRSRLIQENPFADMRAVGVKANRTRDYFLSRGDAAKILDACPDAQWRLLFALSRYGGLRCPSEHLALRWGDIDWAAGRMRVRSPKTEHHAGGESRLVPIFPELKPHLEAAFDEAPEGTEFVITRYRDASQNLRTTFTKIVRRAGLEPWPKLFANLRATCETELAERFPSHVVCSWIGHTATVAQRHYLQTTEEHFKAATNEPKTGNAKAMQNPMQSAAEIPASGCQPRQGDFENVAETREKALLASMATCDNDGGWAAQDSNL